MKNILMLQTTPMQYDGLTMVVFNLLDIAKDISNVTLLPAMGGEDVFYEKAKALGVNILSSPHRSQALSDYKKFLRSVLKEGKYDVIHIHGNSATMAIETKIANGLVPVRIAHGHNTRTNHPLIHKMLKGTLNSTTTNPAACSNEAGKFLFSKDFTIIPNCVDVDRFTFSEEKRARTRASLGVENEPLFGHIGRFSYQKNHEFLINIFEKIQKKLPQAKLLLIGTGEEVPTVRNQVSSLHLEDSVIFLGTTEDIESYLCAMDLFLLPSRFEGRPITLVEAETSGLSVIVSSAVPEDAIITRAGLRMRAECTADEWAEAAVKQYYNTRDRNLASREIKAAGYDIKDLPSTAKKIWGIQ